MGWRTGWRNGFVGIAATRQWFARTWRGRRGVKIVVLEPGAQFLQGELAARETSSSMLVLHTDTWKNPAEF
jgi:hypothetical protein